MQTHKAIVASTAGLEGFLCSVSARATSAANQETYLAYLPAAHILEFCAEVGSGRGGRERGAGAGAGAGGAGGGGRTGACCRLYGAGP